MSFPQYMGGEFYEEEYEEPEYVFEPSQINPFAEGFVLNDEDKAKLFNTEA